MKIKKYYSTVLIIVVVLFCCVAIQFFKKTKPPKQSGAGIALDNFVMARAWPGSIIPHNQYTNAYKKHVQMLVSSKKKDSIEWQAIGPKNFAGRMIGFAFNPQNSKTIWGGSASGGLWKTETDGKGIEAWEYIPTGFPVLGAMAIAVNPLDSNEIYIGTGEVYNYQKTGEGIGERTSRGTYGIGILKSRDNGKSWAKVLDWDFGNLRGVNDLLVNPKQPNTVWAATTEGLYVSYNAGESWNLKVNALNATDILMHPQDTAILFLASGNFSSEGHGIYRSLDGGFNFDKISNGGNGLPETWSGKAMLDMQTQEPFTLFASIANTFNTVGLFSSIDNGDSWSNKDLYLDYARYQGWFSHDVAVHPENEDEVVVVGVNPYKSSDGGKTFGRQSDGGIGSFDALPVGDPEGPPNYVHSDIHRVLYHPENYEKVYYVTDGGIFVSLDGGLTFESRNGGLQTQQFYADFSNSHQDSLFAIGGLQDNSTTIYEGNDSWRRAIGGDGLSTAINPQNDSIVYGSSQYLYISKSTNKAQNFRGISVPESFLPTAFAGPYAMCQSNPDVLYAGRTRVYKTENGKDWDFRSNIMDGTYILRIAIADNDCDLVYACTSLPNNDLFKSANGGANWEDVTHDLPERFILDIVVHPENEDWVYVALGGYDADHLYKSEDGAATWQSISNTLPDLPVNTILVDTVGVDYLYVGTDIGVYASEDDGESWTVLDAGLPDAILAMDLSISPVDRRLRVATHGNGVYQRPLIGESLVNTDSMIVSINEPIIDFDVSVKPNPVSSVLYIDSKQKPIKVVRLYSPDGKLLKSMSFNANSLKVELPMNDLAKGIYQLIIESADGIHSEKVIKI